MDWKDVDSDYPLTSQIEAGRVYVVHDVGLMLCYTVSKDNRCIFIEPEKVIQINKQYIRVSLNTFGSLEFDDIAMRTSMFGTGKYLPKKYRAALKRKGLWSIRDQNE